MTNCLFSFLESFLFLLNVSFSLVCRSVLVLKDNGADIAKHCVPGVPSKRYNYNILCPPTSQKKKDEKSVAFSAENHAVFNLICRISITFRKMDDSKLPYKFLPDPDLLGIKPLI